jgi:hypothetical protein
MTSSHSRFPIFIAYYYLIHTFADSTMRFDSGFDMVPRLGTSMSDTSKWAHFIDQVKFRYRGDPKVELKWNYMLFKAGAHLLLLPFEGHRFLRFSSMVSAGIGDPTEAKQCISTVSHIAQCVFGDRIKSWDESTGQSGEYDWNQVHEAIKSYDKVGHGPRLVIPAHVRTGG